MATLQERVEGLVGTVTNTDVLDANLTAAARIIVDLIPLEKGIEWSADFTAGDGTGITLSILRPLYAHKAYYRARRISAEDKARAADSNSLFYAVAKDPVWYIEKSKAYVLPGGGTIVGIAYPVVKGTDNKIGGFPHAFEEGVVLYAAIQDLLGKKYLKIGTLEALVLDSISTISTPTAPNFTWSSVSYTSATYSNANWADALIDTISATTIADFITMPTYTKPTVSLAALPTNLSYSINVVIPQAPSAPSFNYSDAVLGTYTNTTVGSLGTPPTYGKPTITFSISIPSALDTSLITVPTAPGVPAIAATNASLATYTATTIGSLGTPPTYSKPTTTFSDANVGTYISSEEDFEKANTEITRQNILIEKYGKDLYNELNEFNQELEVYKTTVQKALEQARLDQERLMITARDTTDLNLKNQAQALLAAIKDYELELQLYLGKLDAYGKEINTAIVVYTQNLERYKINADVLLRQYQLDIENEVREFEKENVTYQSSIQTAIENARLAQQRILQQAKDTLDASVQNKLQTINADIQEYESSLRKYAEEIKSYSQVVLAEVTLFKSNLDKWIADRNTTLQQYQLDIQNELNEFNGQLTQYQEDVRKKIEQAKITQERLITQSQMQIELNKFNEQQAIATALANNQQSAVVDIQNKAKALEAAIINATKSLESDIEEYRAVLQKHASDVNNYGIQVNQALQKLQLYISRNIAGLQSIDALIISLQKQFDTILSLLLGISKQGVAQ